jgi:chromate transporter
LFARLLAEPGEEVESSAFCYLPPMRRIDLFLGFFKLGLIGFGGVGPLTRRIVVEERRWLDDREFAALLGLCQALPGANTSNLALMLGDRFRGTGGALAALAGLLLAPLALLVVIASLFAAFAQTPDLRAALYGATAAAAGLAIGTAAKMLKNLPREPLLWGLAALIFVAVAWLRLPLPLVLAVSAPASFLLHARRG